VHALDPDTQIVAAAILAVPIYNDQKLELVRKGQHSLRDIENEAKLIMGVLLAVHAELQAQFS
jgi:hypothetical protein